ncbi:MAG: DUF4209 domain-containing protein [Candidatus Mycalebacterium zealandia]|nr:MAG: DUF4209 domain-containing protein [Candidatus Mycalebacterium zealandia]
MLHERIKEYLEKLDREKNPLENLHGENAFSHEMKKILDGLKPYKPSKEDQIEIQSFDFTEAYRTQDSGWTTYYGSMLSTYRSMFSTPEYEYPDINNIDEQYLDYWSERARQAQNPVLSARYADLVVNFSPMVLSEKADIEMFRKVIDSNIQICENLLAIDIDCKKKIERALFLSTFIKDERRILRAKKATIDLEKKISVDDKPSLWGFSFRLLLLEFPKKVKCTKQEEKELVEELEGRLKRAEKNRMIVECATTPLAEYYHKQKDEQNLMRVLGVLENMLKTDEYINSSHLLILGAYEQLRETYGRYASSFSKAKESENRILQEMSRFDLDEKKSLKVVSAETTIDRKEIDDNLKRIFGEHEERSLPEVLQMVVIQSLPRKENEEKYFNDISKQSPLELIIPKNILSDEGFSIGKANSFDQNFLLHAVQGVQFASLISRFAIDKLKEKFSREETFDYLTNSMLFEKENKNYLKKAVFSYWDGDYLVSSHFFIPLIESGIRELIKRCNGVVLKPNQIGGYECVSLSSLLGNCEYEKDLNQIFAFFGKDVVFYLKLILTERLGLNLRNDFAHGLVKEKFGKRETSDILFCVLSLMSFLKEK